MNDFSTLDTVLDTNDQLLEFFQDSAKKLLIITANTNKEILMSSIPVTIEAAIGHQNAYLSLTAQEYKFIFRPRSDLQSLPYPSNVAKDDIEVFALTDKFNKRYRRANLVVHAIDIIRADSNNKFIFVFGYHEITNMLSIITNVIPKNSITVMGIN